MPTHGQPSQAQDFEAETQQREIQQRVEEQSRILNVALNSIEDFAYVFDRNGCFVYSNPPLLRLLGIKLEDIIGKNFFDLNYPPELAARLQQQIQEVFETKEVVRDETPYTSAAGKAGFYEYIFTPVFATSSHGDGSADIIEFVAGSTRDITQRREAEQEREKLLQQLAAEHAKLDYLFAQAPAFVATLSGPEHIFELVNPAYLQLVGHRDLVGKPARVVLPEIEGQGFFELLDHVFASGESFTGRELPIQLQREPQGALEERFVDFVYQPLFDAQGKVVGIFAHGMDITEQVHARKAAESANRAKDEFLATLSHELRSPLSAIMGWTDILQTERPSPEELAHGLNTIARNARAQRQLIEDILDVSRMVAGKMHLEMQPVSLRSIIEEALSAISPAAQTKDVHFELLLDKGVNPEGVKDQSMNLVSGDPVRLQQVIWNLLSNALKFTPSGGRVQVYAHQSGAHAEIIVSDSGIGMTAETLSYVFDRFRQADASSTRAQGGLGLGLAIVRHLVELHGGSIEAQSEGLGQGARFIVKLPLLTIPPPDSSPDLRRTDNDQVENVPRLNGLHVLVVDDEEDTREFLSVVLKRCGARVTAVRSASEGLAALQEVRPDILLSDIGMPGEDGLSLIKRVRALPAQSGGQTPAAALTAFVRLEDHDQVLRSGFQAHLAKPVSPLELTTIIAGLAKSGAKSKPDAE